MATTLSLVSGATTIALNGSGKVVLEYVPRTPDMSPSEVVRLLTGSKSIFDEPMVNEPIRFIITGANIAAIETAARAIEKMVMIDAPRYWETGQGDRVFLKFQSNGGSTLFRADIAYGKLEPASPAFLDWELRGLAVMYVLGIRRRLYEYNTAAALELTNGNGTDATTGINVYNCNDAQGASPNKFNNFVDIAADDIVGVLPAPISIEMTNTFAAASRRFYIGHKAQGDADDFVHLLEAEDATLNATYSASAVDADCSGGDKVTVTNVAATVVTLMTWAMTAAQAAFVQSQWIRFIARFEDKPNNSTCKVRLTLQDSTTTAIVGQTDWTTLNTADDLQVLGTLQLSPNLQGQTNLGAMKLVLEGKDSAATCDFGIDYLMMMPIEAGSGFRFLKPVDETLVSVAASTGILTDNGIDGSGPIVDARQDVYAGFGGPIMLIPGRLNRLYFLWDGSNASAAIARVISVIATYRPRVLTL